MIYWLQIKEQINGISDIRLNIPDGITAEKAEEISRRINDRIDEQADFVTILEQTLKDTGVEYAYTPVDYTIYI